MLLFVARQKLLNITSDFNEVSERIWVKPNQVIHQGKGNFYQLTNLLVVTNQRIYKE